MKRLVLVGGGHANVEVLRDVAVGPLAGFAVTLVTPSRWLYYSGMVPGVFAGHYAIDECTIDLADLAARAKAKVVYSSASALDLDRREVTCDDSSVIGYDILSIDVGPGVSVGRARGVAEHAIAMRPLEQAVKAWLRVLEHVRNGDVGAISVIGGGAAGVEMAFAIDYRLRTELVGYAAHVRVFTDSRDIVPEFPAGARRRLRAELRRCNVGVHADNAVAEVEPDVVRTIHGHEFSSDAVFWVTGAAPHGWLGASGLATDARGFVLTNRFLQSVSHADVFAAGDCASREDVPHAKAGVFAVRAAPTLAANLRAALANQPLQPHEIKTRFLALVSTGRRHAVGVWNGFSWEGDWVWRLKDRIDRQFVERYRLG